MRSELRAFVTTILTLMLISLTLSIAGCAAKCWKCRSYVNPQAKKVSRIAVVPFNWKSDHKGMVYFSSSVVWADSFAYVLHDAWNETVIINATEVARHFKSSSFKSEDFDINISLLDSVAAHCGAEAVLTGAISETSETLPPTRVNHSNHPDSYSYRKYIKGGLSLQVWLIASHTHDTLVAYHRRSGQPVIKDLIVERAKDFVSIIDEVKGDSEVRR